MRLAGLANLPVVEHPAGVVAFGQRVDIRGQVPQAKDSHQEWVLEGVALQQQKADRLMVWC